MKLYKSLGSLIKEYRQYFKISQEKLAELVKIGVRELQYWEADRHSVRVENLHDLSDSSGIPMQVCIALDIGQPIYYSLLDRHYWYSKVEMVQDLFHASLASKELEDKGLISNDPIESNKHICKILSYHCSLSGTKRLLDTNLIRKACMILPDLNRILFDCWGHYVGHRICLPIQWNVYQKLKIKIKEGKSLESFFQIENIRDILALHEGVFFIYSSFAASPAVVHSLILDTLQYFSKIERKERFLYAAIKMRGQWEEVFEGLSFKKIELGAIRGMHREGSSAIYEQKLNTLMEVCQSLGWMLNGDNKQAGTENLIRKAKWKGLPAILTQKLNNDSRSEKNYLTVSMSKSGPLISDDIINKTCLNPKCTLYSKTGKGNIVSYGNNRTKEGNLTRRFLCKDCGKSFCSRAGSIFYDLRSPEKKVLMALGLLVKGMSIRGVSKTLSVKRDTVRHWVKIAAEQSGKIDAMLTKELNVSQVELDSFWNFVKSNSLRQRASLWKGRYGLENRQSRSLLSPFKKNLSSLC